MAIIRVDTVLLKQVSGQVSTFGFGLGDLGSRLEQTAAGAPSYDGQFHPKVYQVGIAAKSQAGKYTTGIVEAAADLNRRAALFETVDGAAIYGFSSILSWLGFIGGTSTLLGVYWLDAGLLAQIRRLLQYGYLFGTNVDQGTWEFIPWFFPWLLPWLLPNWKEGLRPSPSEVPPPDITPFLQKPANSPPPLKDWNYEYKAGGKFPLYGDGTIHPGLDLIPNGADKRVTPIGPGQVFFVGTEYEKDKNGNIVLDEDGKPKLGGYGNYVIIKHLTDKGVIYSLYAHLESKPSFETGDLVNVDTVLGVMGDSGNVSGPHLHLEIYSNHQVKLTGTDPNALYDSNDIQNSPTNLEQLQKDHFNPAEVLNGTVTFKYLD